MLAERGGEGKRAHAQALDWSRGGWCGQAHPPVDVRRGPDRGQPRGRVAPTAVLSLPFGFFLLLTEL